MERLTRIVPRRGVNDDGLGKKHALHKLISTATTDYVWLSDADVLWPDASAHDRLTAPIAPTFDLLILPLRMTAGNGSLLARLQQTEYAALQALTLFTAAHGYPVLCSGANLIVCRERWLESWPDLHPELASGDDMFLLESFKRRHLRIAAWAEDTLACRTTDTAGTTDNLSLLVPAISPQPTLRALLRQRMRWAGKALHYTDRDIRLCGALVVAANLLTWLPPVFIVKYAVDLWLVRRARRFGFAVPHDWAYALLLEVLYPLYMLSCLLGGLLRTSLHPLRW